MGRASGGAASLGRIGFGQAVLMGEEQAFEDGDDGAQVVAEPDEQVDVIEVFLAAEAVAEVVTRVNGSEHFAAVGAEEAEADIAALTVARHGPALRW